MKEQLWRMAIFALMALFLTTGAALADAPTYSGGAGTQDDPYRIANLADLRELSEYPDHWRAHFRQAANIDAAAAAAWNEGAGWSPIGNLANPFRGTYDGGWFTIDGLSLNREDGERQGFFGYAEGAAIKNLGLTSANISGQYHIGILAGMLYGAGSVVNCYSTGAVSGTTNVGGLVGANSSAYILNSYSAAAVSATDSSAGGLAGRLINAGAITNSYSTGAVSGVRNVGGFAGFLSGESSVTNSYSTGAVSATGDYVGGFLGRFSGTTHTVADCFWDVDRSGLGESGDENYGATGKRTADMKTESTFTDAGWQFSLLWAVDPGVNDGYPHHSLVQRPSGDSEEPAKDQEGVYLVETLANMLWIAEGSDRWGSECHYRQVADIDATDTRIWDGGMGWSPIGNSTSKFRGTYDGGGFTIDGLFIFQPAANSAGLFGHAQDAKIMNLGLRAVNIFGGHRVGGLAGSLEGAGSIDNCYSRGAVSGTGNSIGGLAGSLLDDSFITNSYGTGAVSGPGIVGGIAGVLYNNSMVVNSYSVGSVSAIHDYVGGIAGRIMNSGSVYNSYSRVDVSGNRYVGGLVGRLEGPGFITRSYSTGGVSGGSDTGGFMGSVLGANYTITNCFWDVETSGQNESAGVGATGKSTTDMKTESTFTDAGWIFPGIWNMDPGVNEGYPHHAILQWTTEDSEEPTLDENGVYLVETLAHLLWIAEDSDRWAIDYHYRQIANIDASGTRNMNDVAGWSPIGNGDHRFYGTYDGGGFAIDGLFIQRPATDYVGLFGYIQGAAIKNLGLGNVDIRGRYYVGGLVGRSTQNSSVTNCYSRGEVVGAWNVGGLLGTLEGSGSVINSYSTASVSGPSYVGGLVGLLSGASYIVNSYSVGPVSGVSFIGGFAGYVSGAYAIINCFWDVNTSGQEESAGVGATGKNTVDMKTEATFTEAHWNFYTIWAVNPNVNRGYPYHILLHSIIGDSAEPGQDQNGVYLVETLAHLLWIAEDFDRWGTDYHYRQVADIDASGTRYLNDVAGWSPIGNSNNRFHGTYDGGGFAIDGLYILRPDNDYVGLFGFIQGATIKNLVLRSLDIRGRYYVGGLAALLTNKSSVVNCYSTGEVVGSWYVGGLLGMLDSSGSVIDSYSTGPVAGHTSIGGLVGEIHGGSSAVNSYSTSPVSGNTYVGGLAGSLRNNSAIVNSYSRGPVSGSTYVGGLVGEITGDSSAVNSYSTGAVSGTTSAGGFVGNVPGTYTIADCLWDKDTSGQGESAGVGATGKTTAEMKTEATFTDAGWVFPGAWVIDPEVNDGYPHYVVYSLTYSPDGNGSIRGAPVQMVPYGGNGSPVEAIPDAGYLFVQWTDGVTDNPRTDFNVTASIVVTARFTVHLKYIIAVLQVLSGMEPQFDFFIDNGPVGIHDAIRLLQRSGEP